MNVLKVTALNTINESIYYTLLYLKIYIINNVHRNQIFYTKHSKWSNYNTYNYHNFLNSMVLDTAKMVISVIFYII